MGEKRGKSKKKIKTMTRKNRLGKYHEDPEGSVAQLVGKEKNNKRKEKQEKTTQKTGRGETPKKKL